MMISVSANEETVMIEVEEFGSLEKIRRSAMAPDAIKGDISEVVQPSKEIINFMRDVTIEQTILSEEDLNVLTMEECMKTMSRIVMAAFGKRPDPLDSNDYKFDSNEVDFNDNGSVDLEDWR